MHRLRILVAVLALTGCTTGSAMPPPVAAPPDPTPTAPVVVPLPADWVDDDVVVTAAPTWQVRGCEGDAPMLCVTEAGAPVGTIGLAQHGLWAGGAPDERRRGLIAEANDHLEGLREDRSAWCSGQTFHADEVVSVEAPEGTIAVRLGFTMTDSAGDAVERVVTYLVLDGDVLWSINATALDPGNDCQVADEQLFLPATLARFASTLDAIVAGTALPAPDQRLGA